MSIEKIGKCHNCGVTTVYKLTDDDTFYSDLADERLKLIKELQRQIMKFTKKIYEQDLVIENLMKYIKGKNT